MKALSDYRAEARAALKGNWAYAALFSFVAFLISGVLSGISGGNTDGEFSYGVFGVSIIATILILPLEWSFAIAMLRLLRGEELQIEMLFDGYTKKRVWFTMILANVYVFLWTLLFIIPGIIKIYSYTMSQYLIKDNEELSAEDAIKESMKIMNGRKMDLFLLDLTFIGWIFLGILTLGIGLLWVRPYWQTARAAFYEDAKKEYYGE